MADNVRLKIYNDGWVEIHNETNIEQILGLSFSGKKLLELSHDVNNETFIKVHTSGGIELVEKGDMPSHIGAALAVHPHEIADINNLQASLNAKADISGGKILSTQIPGYLIGGMKKAESYEVSDATVTIGSAFRALHGMDNSGTTEGKYVIITNANGCDVDLDANHILTTGDEGQITGTIHLEEGDWIVFRGYDGTNYEFDVINNKYRVATTTERGVGRLSPGTVTARTGLASSSNSDKIIDEFALSKVLKGIYRVTNAATDIANPKNGDLAIEVIA